MLLWLGFVVVLGFTLLGFAGYRAEVGRVDPSAREGTTSGEEAIEALKQRYVEGAIDIETLERRAKRLYETDEADSVPEPTAGTRTRESTRTGTPEQDTEANRPARRSDRTGRGWCHRKGHRPHERQQGRF
ncbi:MAG: hypothetical protein ABEJ84_04640 [Halodesulfurarchaeum sp.]